MNKWKSKKVLITGAGGFIGSHLAETLVQKGADVRAMVHYRGSGSWGWLDHSVHKKDFEVLPGDVRDSDFVRRAVKEVDIIFHLAALISIPYSYSAPDSYVQTNVMGTLNILEAARVHDVERIVHTSSSEVYGTARYVPMDEKHPLQAQSPYAASKIAADKLAESFFLSFKTPVVTVRPFNTFGPRQSARAIIPTIMTQLLNEKRISLGNTNPTRDFNYINNTVDGFVLAAETSSAIGKTINIGSGQETRIIELKRLIEQIHGKKGAWTSQKERIRPKRSEVDRLLANASLAKRLLGWKPKVNLKDGLALTLDWIRQNQHHFRTDTYAV